MRERLGQEVEPVEVTVFDLQKYRQHLVDEGYKAAGINRRLAALRAFFAWAMEHKLVATNPA
ncbi:MAG: site-specific integrase, partial [Anaerolineae bacterium]